jgi:hypothetical protein
MRRGPQRGEGRTQRHAQGGDVVARNPGPGELRERVVEDADLARRVELDTVAEVADAVGPSPAGASGPSPLPPAAPAASASNASNAPSTLPPTVFSACRRQR